MFAGQAWNIREPVVATREKGHPHVTMGARLEACAFHPPYVSSGERIGVCFGPTSQTHGLSNYLRPAMHGTVPLTLIFYALKRRHPPLVRGDYPYRLCGIIPK